MLDNFNNTGQWQFSWHLIPYWPRSFQICHLTLDSKNWDRHLETIQTWDSISRGETATKTHTEKIFPIKHTEENGIECVVWQQVYDHQHHHHYHPLSGKSSSASCFEAEKLVTFPDTVPATLVALSLKSLGRETSKRCKCKQPNAKKRDNKSQKTEGGKFWLLPKPCK